MEIWVEGLDKTYHARWYLLPFWHGIWTALRYGCRVRLSKPTEGGGRDEIHG